MEEATVSPERKEASVRKTITPILWGILFGTWLGLIIWLVAA